MNKIPKNIFGLFFVFSLILVGSFVFTNKASAATTYYVSTSGLDTNNGTSTSTPWAHHPWDLNATNTSLGTALQPDDTVIMKKGDVWWDCQLQAHDSGTSGHNIVTTSSDTFGSGSLPVCSGSPDTTSYNSGWTNDGGNIWHRTITTEPKIVVYNGNILLADTGVTPALNKYYWSANTLYVNIGGDPNSTTAWRVGKRGIPGYISANYITLKDLTFEVGNGTVVSMVYIETHTGVILDGLTIRYGIKSAVFDDPGGISNEIKNCTLSDIKSNSGVPGIMLKIINPTNSSYHNNTIIGGTQGILTTTGSSGTNSIYSNTIYGQTVYNTGAAGISINAGTGWSVHDNIIHDIGDVNSSAIYGILVTTNSNNIYLNTIYNSRLYGINIASSASSNNIYQNTVYNNGVKTVDGSDWFYYGAGGGGVGISVSGTSANNNIYKNYAHDNYTGITQGTTGGAGNNRYYYNLVTNSVVNGMGDTGDTATGTATIFYNNTIYHNPSVHNTPAYRGHGLYMENLSAVNGAGNAIFANNIIYSVQSGTNTQGIWIQSDNVAYLNSLKMDNNDVYVAIPGAYIAVVNIDSTHTNYTTPASYRGISGIQTLSSKITGLDGIQANAEIHSINSDPLFTSFSNFKLLPTSPAINTGTNVSLTSDYLGNPIVGLPDIGAYEFQAPTIPTSLSQYKADGTTTITSGAFTNEDSVVLKFNMSSSEYNSSDSLTPQVEIQELDVPFTNTVTNSGTAVAYSGTSVIGTVTVTGLTSGKTYHWQARTSNPATTSAWVAKGGNPDFGVITTVPENPVVTPIANSYNSTQSVTLSAVNSNYIKYSLDSLPATCSDGTSYGGQISVSESQTIYVRACDNAGNSSTANFQYIIDTTVPLTPVATPAQGMYNTTKSVTLTASGSDSIRYATDTTPANCSSGILYNAETPIEVSTTETIYVRACDLATNSSTASFLYTIDTIPPSDPVATPVIGLYNATQFVSLSAEGSSYIKYSLTETPATCSVGTAYEGLIEISSSQTIYARACDDAGNSSTQSFAYVIDTEAPSTAIATPSADTYTSTQSVSLTSVSSDSIRYSTTETPADCSSGTLYNAETPISVSSSQTIYVRACDNAGNSSTTSFAYVISPIHHSSGGSSIYAIAQFKATQQALTPTPTPPVITPTPPVPFTPIVLSRIIKLSTPRMWGDDVLALQTLLNTKGYDSGTPDGNFGPKTQTAVIAFQKANGLVPDGFVGTNTLKYLNGNQTTTNPTVTQSTVTRILKLSVPRMIGDDVKTLQTYLSEKGYDAGTPDGIFGNKTKNAIMAFQTANRLTPDGLVGAKTREMMK